MKTAITYHLFITVEGVKLNGERYKEFPQVKDLHSWLSELYNHLQIDYPKFHKMDHLCKLAFLGVELLVKENDLSTYQADDIALVFQNSQSSLDTDQKHQSNIDNQKSSPATFVYTLPNILLGEIAIRNQWYGENLFLLRDEFDLDQWMQTSQTLLDSNKAKAVVGGWVEVLDEHFDLRLYMIK